jgi:hypothetical protein
LVWRVMLCVSRPLPSPPSGSPVMQICLLTKYMLYRWHQCFRTTGSTLEESQPPREPCVGDQSLSGLQSAHWLLASWYKSKFWMGDLLGPKRKRNPAPLLLTSKSRS